MSFDRDADALESVKVEVDWMDGWLAGWMDGWMDVIIDAGLAPERHPLLRVDG